MFHNTILIYCNTDDNKIFLKINFREKEKDDSKTIVPKLNEKGNPASTGGDSGTTQTQMEIRGKNGPGGRRGPVQ